MSAQAIHPKIPFSGAPSRRGDVLGGIWRVADPKITLASVASMILGACIAAARGAIDWLWLGLTVLGIFFIEAAKNSSGEIVDWDSGADQALNENERTPFSGGKRVLVDGLMTRRQTAVMAFVFYALGTISGLSIVIFREPRVLWFGLAGVALAFFYHAPPARLSYRGWGEAAVAVTYGPLIVLGTEVVQRGRPSVPALLASLPLGLMIAAFLWVNELPDRRADESAGKRTIVVRLGARRAARVYPAIVAAAFLFQALLPWLARVPGTALGMLGLPPAVAAALMLDGGRAGTARVASAQALTLVSFLILAVAGGIGFFLL